VLARHRGRQATESFSGFETKKTVAIRYKNRDVFERIVSAAAVLSPLGLEPMVQYSIYLRMQYQVRRSSMN
jgi:hypothetical protein